MTLQIMETRARADILRNSRRGQAVQHAVRNDAGFGRLLRDWRKRRGRSQDNLADAVPLSQRHLSCLERGIARPGRDTAIRLAEVLNLPAEATNALLAAAGFAPVFPSRPFAAPELKAVREAIDRILAAQAPNPALAVDRHWNLLASNRAVDALLHGIPPGFLAAPMNVLRLSLHPEGLAPRVVNLREWRAHLLRRLDQEIEKSGDAALAALAAELAGYPLPPGTRPYRAPTHDPLAGIAVPLILQSGVGRLSLLSTTTVFGTATDITVAGVTIETFGPADDQTAGLLQTLASQA